MTEDEVKADSRVKTGIQGLDVLLEGGFLPGSVVLLRGESGTGKTILGLQFVSFGALQREPGIFVTLTETASDIKRQAACFGWDLDDLESQHMLEIVEIKPWLGGFNHTTAIEKVVEIAKEMNAKRVVIDSIPALLYRNHAKTTPDEMARALCLLSWKLGQELHATTILISKLSSNGNSTIEEDVSGVIVELRLTLAEGGMKRFLLVRKMRQTQHSAKLYVFDFSPKGLVVYNPMSTWAPPQRVESFL